jgi:hypothetical protein
LILSLGGPITKSILTNKTSLPRKRTRPIRPVAVRSRKVFSWNTLRPITITITIPIAEQCP